MPRDLFGDVTRPSISIGNRKWYSVPVSLLSHSIVLAMIVIVPILAAPMMPGVLDGNTLTRFIDIVPPTPPPLGPRPEKIPESEPNGPPFEAPKGFAPERPPIETGWEADRGPGFVDGELDRDVVLAPPPVVKPAAPPVPVRVGGAVRTPQKINEVNPVYPPIAQSARVQGIVIIEATIGENGQVVNARILRSVPLLDQAALDAVRQWQYSPTLLNGVPVPVIMTVTVNFTLR